jgi:PIF1-like helicase
MPHGTRADIVLASLKNSDIWEKFHVRQLTINMRTMLGSNESKKNNKNLWIIY